MWLSQPKLAVTRGLHAGGGPRQTPEPTRCAPRGIRGIRASSSLPGAQCSWHNLVRSRLLRSRQGRFNLPIRILLGLVDAPTNGVGEMAGRAHLAAQDPATFADARCSEGNRCLVYGRTPPSLIIAAPGGARILGTAARLKCGEVRGHRILSEISGFDSMTYG